MGEIFDSQFKNRCADLVLNLHECFEAYGLATGRTKCKDIQYDLDECNTFDLRRSAVKEVYRVRLKKILTGELKLSESYLPPAPPNSFVYFPHHK